MIEIGYYPGCALHGSSDDYEQSVQACMRVLDARLKEIDDWICCGATAAHCLNHKLSVALPARNLGLAEKGGFSELLAPCPMCSMELMKAQRLLTEKKEARAEFSEIVELDIKGTTQVINMIQAFERIGLERIQAAVKKPQSDLRPACYYGCLLTRPPKTVQFDDAEQPSSMERIMEIVGAKPVEWNYRTECCGAGMTMSSEETVLELSGRILANAVQHGANCLVVACPMCHVNLDMKQGDVERKAGVEYGLPVYYLSDVVGLALGLTERKLGIRRHFVTKRPKVEAQLTATE